MGASAFRSRDAAERMVVFGVSFFFFFFFFFKKKKKKNFAFIGASPGGGYKPPSVMPSSLPRAYLVAGINFFFFFF